MADVKESYIIIREKDGKTEYFFGANIYGRDADGILKVNFPTWHDSFYQKSKDAERMKDILDGMFKYGAVDAGYRYSVVKIQTVSTIVDTFDFYTV